MILNTAFRDGVLGWSKPDCWLAGKLPGDLLRQMAALRRESDLRWKPAAQWASLLGRTTRETVPILQGLHRRGLVARGMGNLWAITARGREHTWE